MSPWLSDLVLRSQTDERLIALSQLGHKRAFELIVERYCRPLTAYAHRIDPHRAEDLVQQTFLSALSALRAGTEVRHLRGWLYEILRNQARRDYASSPALAELDEADSVTESAQQVAERRMLAVDALGAVAQLPPRQHDAIVQMAFQGLSRSEVASSMGLSEGAVRQLVHRARAALRTAVTAITPMPVLRWLYSPRSGSGSGLTEVTLGAGTASGAGIALKVSVGVIVASGVVAGGVISVVSPHHRVAAQLASHSQSAGGRLATALGGGAEASGLTSQVAAVPPRTALGRASRPGRDGGTKSSSRGQGAGEGGSGSGGQNGGNRPGSGTSGPGAGDRGSSGSDGGSTRSGGGGTDGGGSSTSDGSSGSGTTGGDGGGGGGSNGGDGSQPTAVTSGDGGGSSSGDGGPVSSGGGSGPSPGSDGGSLTGTSGSGSGSSGGSSSDTGSSSDGGSSSLDGSGASSGSASGS